MFITIQFALAPSILSNFFISSCLFIVSILCPTRYNKGRSFSKSTIYQSLQSLRMVLSQYLLNGKEVEILYSIFFNNFLFEMLQFRCCKRISFGNQRNDVNTSFQSLHDNPFTLIYPWS